MIKPSSNWSLFKLIISDQKLIKLKCFCLYMCILIGKRLAVFLNTLHFTSKFFGLKIQKSTFLKKNDFESSFFYKIDIYVVTN